MVEHFFLNSERTKQFSFCDNHLCSHNCGSFHQKIAAWKISYFSSLSTIFGCGGFYNIFLGILPQSCLKHWNLIWSSQIPIWPVLLNQNYFLHLLKHCLVLCYGFTDALGWKPIFSQFVGFSPNDDLNSTWNFLIYLHWH